MEMTNTFCNQKLTPSEQSAVSASLAEIKLNENFQRTRFWGKIYGEEHDYLIVEAATVTHEVRHKFFFRLCRLRIYVVPIAMLLVSPLRRLQCGWGITIRSATCRGAVDGGEVSEHRVDFHRFTGLCL